jgi:hypothetical protein
MRLYSIFCADISGSQTSWSFSGLLNFLNPLRSSGSAEPEPEPDHDMEEISSLDEQDNEAGVRFDSTLCPIHIH